MNDRGIIYAGLLVFLGLITFPFSYNLVTGKTSKGPDIKLPLQEKQCVAPLETMKSSHMKMLTTWRDDRVRRNKRSFVSSDGKTYALSLTATCLTDCHTSKAEFCDRCHDYAGVPNPYCMDCHIDPSQAKRSEP